MPKVIVLFMALSLFFCEVTRMYISIRCDLHQYKGLHDGTSGQVTVYPCTQLGAPGVGTLHTSKVMTDRAALPSQDIGWLRCRNNRLLPGTEHCPVVPL